MKKDLTNPETKAVALKAREEANAMRREAINRKGRAGDRREHGDCRNAQDSIASFCAECMGFGDDPGFGTIHKVIENCAAPECHLYPWRGGKLHAQEVIDERG